MTNLIESNLEVAWILCGDFNEVRKPDERKGSVFVERGAQLFNKFIESLDLFEPSLGGHKYAWVNANGTKASKLDRFLLSSNMVDLWPSFKNGSFATNLLRPLPCFVGGEWV